MVIKAYQCGPQREIPQWQLAHLQRQASLPMAGSRSNGHANFEVKR